MPTAYATYFDSGYLSRGLALIESLREHGDASPVWIMALDDQVPALVAAAGLPDVTVIGVEAIEEEVPGLSALKGERTRMEYYFTTTPLLIAYVMRHSPAGTDVAYLDADLVFTADPALVWEALGDGSVGIIEHRYPPRLARRLAKYGRYNVGWVGFRDDDRGRTVLDWWGEQTLAWCGDTPTNGKYADQGYLDEFPTRFDGVTVIPDLGMDAAPWNSARWTWRAEGDTVTVDGEPLVFFHMHALRRVGRWWMTAQLQYGAPAGRVLRERVYTPYVRRLEAWEARIPVPARPAKRGVGLRGIAFRAVQRALHLVGIVTGNAVRAHG